MPHENKKSPEILIQLVDTPVLLQKCLELRKEVFVKEQQVPLEEELDEFDELSASCQHFSATLSCQPNFTVGTARFILIKNQCKAQRVAVAKAHRKKNIGRALMQAIEKQARLQKCSEIILGAQLSAMPFYQALHYAAYGPIFLDAGIEHRMMRLILRPS